jgi:hypothetical protein
VIILNRYKPKFSEKPPSIEIDEKYPVAKHFALWKSTLEERLKSYKESRSGSSKKGKKDMKKRKSSHTSDYDVSFELVGGIYTSF